MSSGILGSTSGKEPKKSARLAEKRKLREEAGPSGVEEDYYFTPLTKVNRGISSTINRQSSTSPLLVTRESSSDTPQLEQKSNKLKHHSLISKTIPNTLSPSDIPSQRYSTSPPLVSVPLVNNTIVELPVIITTSNELQSETSYDVKPETATTTTGSPTTVIKVDTEEEKPEQSSDKILYINRMDLITLSFPPGMDYPLPMKSSLPPAPPVTFCFISGCPNRKKYSCSRTKVPLCSLECYNKNLRNMNLPLFTS